MTDKQIILSLTRELEAATKPKWISVSDEKAPVDACIDVWVDYQDMTGRLCNCFYNPKNNKFWYWDDKGKNKIQFYADYATHWMYIPPAPEVK